MTDAPLIPAFVNPGSGNAGKARDALASTGRFDIREVEPDNLEGEVRQAVEGGATRILVAGGDGTIGIGASVVAGTAVELAVLPAGTLNHFARDMEIPVDLPEAAAAAGGTSMSLSDVAYVGDKLFLNTSSIGAYVIFARVREKLEARLPYKLASVLAMVSTFLKLRVLAVELEIEGKRQVYRTPLVFIGVDERELQFPTLGNRIKDGQRGLHVMVVRWRGRGKLLSLGLRAIFRGVDEVSRTVEFDSFVVERCTITMKKPIARVARDGEIETMSTPLEYRIERDMLHVVVAAAGGESSDAPAPS
ncbi:MAG: diacylglycerol kinase [Gemmatimonadota bacterium]|nr:diacylglycerol kinase [Gemmatimonadota bacterium]